MSIWKNGDELYAGRVIGEDEHMWADGMMDVYAIVWTGGVVKRVQTGYYGADGCNLCAASHTIDATQETARAVLKSFKLEALSAYERSVIEAKTQIKAGCTAKVIKGRKVPKGTELSIFWTGERETYRSRQYSWMHETETVAGGYTPDGEKIWIKVDYLERVDHPKCPRSSERKKFIRAYVTQRARNIPGSVDLLKLARA